jgi:DNA-binding CsgD family transcriptional regulator
MLDQLLADVRGHRGRVLVLRGEAGVGKTALMEHLATASTGCRVVRAAGVESEMELAFAGLHQLCATMLDRVVDLPGPQRDALRTAFGLLAGEPADRFLVGLAVLTLLSAAAEDRPLICLVDDGQWLDQVSAQTLAFVARRLLAESIALVFCVREPSDALEFEGLPERTVGGLSNHDARALLEAVSPGRLDDSVRDRIVAETRGNPLALIELPRSLTAGELAGGFALPAARPMASHIEQSFVRRVELLPPQTQRVLRLAAAEPVGDGVLLRRAADRLGIAANAEVAAEDDGLIEFGAKVRFRHPLVRSAAYRTGSAADRRAVHGALAEATDPQVDPDRRAWHRAHAAAGPDEGVATDLERSAERAESRGGAAAAAAFLERAAQLTPDPARRSARTIAAARAKFDAAAYDAADALVAAAEAGPLTDLQKAQVARLRAEIVYARTRGRDAPGLLLDAARRLDGLDDRLARETYLEALGAAIFAGGASPHPTVREVAEAARAAPIHGTAPTLTDLLLDGVATRFTDGYAAAVVGLQTALQVFRRHIDEGGAGSTRWFWLAWLIAGEVWDDGLQEELAARAVRLARDSGALGDLPIALTYRAAAHINAGEFTAASVLIEETDSITAATGFAPLGFASISLAIWRGSDANVLDRFAEPFEGARQRGEGRALEALGYAVALLNNGFGRYDVALAGAKEAWEHAAIGLRGFVLVELIEAASRCGARQDAARALRELHERTIAAGTEWALGMLARSRALLDDGKTAEGLYVEAIERLGRTRIVVQLARAHLVYGEWLRRVSRRRDAREQLRVAYDLLHDMGAEAFAERARTELVATGETARERTVAAQTDLTPQESRIARLAAAGHTNPEIGSELFISPRTVEYHLSKVFTKLGVTTRRELRRIGPQLNR